MRSPRTPAASTRHPLLRRSPWSYWPRFVSSPQKMYSSTPSSAIWRTLFTKTREHASSPSRQRP
eukprot:504171-Lingulodinium_polyedra.AAC.1